MDQEIYGESGYLSSNLISFSNIFGYTCTIVLCLIIIGTKTTLEGRVSSSLAVDMVSAASAINIQYDKRGDTHILEYKVSNIPRLSTFLTILMTAERKKPSINDTYTMIDGYYTKYNRHTFGTNISFPNKYILFTFAPGEKVSRMEEVIHIKTRKPGDLLFNIHLTGGIYNFDKLNVYHSHSNTDSINFLYKFRVELFIIMIITFIFAIMQYSVSEGYFIHKISIILISIITFTTTSVFFQSNLLSDICIAFVYCYPVLYIFYGLYSLPLFVAFKKELLTFVIVLFVTYYIHFFLYISTNGSFLTALEPRMVNKTSIYMLLSNYLLLMFVALVVNIAAFIDNESYDKIYYFTYIFIILFLLKTSLDSTFYIPSSQGDISHKIKMVIIEYVFVLFLSICPPIFHTSFRLQIK